MSPAPVTFNRPWGSYTVLDDQPNFKLKRIDVHVGQKLSLQYHHHRSEHWVVVQGEAQVINGDQTLHLAANESTYIPVGNVHRLSNVGNETLILIEVQCGDYFGEDDIIRLADDYGRLLKS